MFVCMRCNIQLSMFKEENTLNASTQFDEVLKALGVVGASDDETKAILCILASICHLGEAGPSKGQFCFKFYSFREKVIVDKRELFIIHNLLSF